MEEHRADLKAIARRAMIDRGLLPDFSDAVMAEVGRITSPAIEDDSRIRDLRGLLWASIDNDDSVDLDQLTVAESLPGGAVKILVAIADVDALVKKERPSTITPGTIPRPSTPLRRSSRCCPRRSLPILPLFVKAKNDWP